jgi:D-serine deaminase-like pyridoxal phosphate-dependent protein
LIAVNLANCFKANLMAEKIKYWYQLDEPVTLDTPALLVYPDRVKQNINTAISMVNEVSRLRPHVKTHKSPDVTKLMISAGIQKFKCATIAEAEMLGICAAKDVLLAYQPVGPKLQRLAELIRKYPATKFSCLVDHLPAATEMDRVFVSEGLCVPVYIDIDLGQHRTGIQPGSELIKLYLACAVMKGIRPIGLHGYDGHIRDQDWNLRKQHCDEAFATIEAMQKEIADQGQSLPLIVAGGSPTFSIHCQRKDIECSPGTFIYWDKGYLDLCPEQHFLPAALVLSRVISLPGETRICIDLGHKSIAPENELSRRVYFLDQAPLLPIGQSEEHLVLEAGARHGYQIGDLIYGMPYHICPTVALYERAITIENGGPSGEWKTIARDRKINV